MSEKKPTEILAEIKAGLESADLKGRLENVQALALLNFSSEALFLKLTELLKTESDTELCDAIEKTLNSPIHQKIAMRFDKENLASSLEEDAELDLSKIEQALTQGNVEERLAGISELSLAGESNAKILDQLERMAIKDRSKRVRVSALEALDLPANVEIFKARSKITVFTRSILVQEINLWKDEGILDENTAKILEKRYSFDFEKDAEAELKYASVSPKKPSVPPKKTAKAVEPLSKEKRSWAQALFSESSIKIALYLGAFFVIAAAMIFAAIIKELRLPILFLSTLVFGGTSLAIKKRLPQPSFALFIIFSVFLPINFAVLLDTLNLHGRATSVYWMSVFALTTLVWVFAIYFFSSRFFSLLAFVSLGVSLFFFIELFNNAPIDLYFLAFSFSGLVALIGVKLLRKWKNEKFSDSLFYLTQVQEILLLYTSLIAFLFQYVDGDRENIWWLVTTAIWLVAALFYVFSYVLKKKLPFHYFAVLSLLPVSWLFLNTFEANNIVQSIALFLWGAILMGSGEGVKRSKNEKIQVYGNPLLYGSVPLLLGASLFGWVENNALAFSILLGSAILYSLLTFYRVRWWTWSLALLFSLFSYLAFFELNFLGDWDFYLGFKLLIPGLLLLISNLLTKGDFQERSAWRFPPLALGLFLFFSSSLVALISPQDIAWKATLIFSLYAILALAYALRYAPQIAYIANFYFLLIVIYILRSQNAEHWFFPLIMLTIAYYLIGLGLGGIKKSTPWADIYRFSGLILGTLLAFSTPFDDIGLWASIIVAIVATLFTFEAFKKRNIWLGFPANAFYLMAYFMLLFEINVEQPQFYSIIAAVLGMVMHYLLRRVGNNKSAFIMGMLSQLVLLSTTYVQIITEEKFLYFVVLFFQAVAVLTYGVVIRSRSLVITPIIFLVLSVITVTFGLLQGILSLVLIGCAGVFLILFGISALLLREKFTALREKIDDWDA